jgi:glycosyltransferase involved in cell wall biosynthesis
MNNKDKELYELYQKDKLSESYLNVFEKENPLVSVVIATYNAGEMLENYSLKSVLNQTHKNLEIIIIDDGSTDDTEARVLSIKDDRIIYRKLDHTENSNWNSTSVSVINYGMKLCTGDYVCHLDDDDFFLPNKIETLVNFNRTAKAEIVHHPFYIHYPAHELYKRVLMESLSCSCGNVTTSSLFYHGWFSRVMMGDEENLQALTVPGDWDKARKILEFGGQAARCPDMLLLKNGNIVCNPLRNRVYRPQIEEGEPKNILNINEDINNGQVLGINGTDIFFVDKVNNRLRKYRWNDVEWIQIGKDVNFSEFTFIPEIGLVNTLFDRVNGEE